MNCVRCNVEMKPLHKWRFRPVREFERVANACETTSLVTFCKTGKIVIREESRHVSIIPYICPQCGCVENHVDKNSIEFILAAEGDDSFRC